MTTRALTILKAIDVALAGDPCLEAIIDARTQLVDIIPVPDDDTRDALDAIGESLCRYNDAAFAASHSGAIDEWAELSHALAMALGLVTDGLIEVGRVEQQGEVPVQIPVEEGV